MVPTVAIKHRKCNDLRRWKLEDPIWGWSIRLHHWVKGDPEEYQHAHPWRFMTFVLWGGYVDRADGRRDDVLHALSFRFRDLDWRHSVVDVKPHTWTIVITGPKLKPWRFWIRGRQVDRSEWDARICD